MLHRYTIITLNIEIGNTKTIDFKLLLRTDDSRLSLKLAERDQDAFDETNVKVSVVC